MSTTPSHTSALDPPLPPAQLRLMGDDDERYVQVAAGLVETLRRSGLGDDDAVLDVGCGAGRLAIGLLRDPGFRGTYVGFDVQERPIAWCQAAITPVAPGYAFHHVDARNSRYNRAGAVRATGARFPGAGSAYETVAMFSVFTHFPREDLLPYLREIRRVLRPGGTAVTTWLLWDADRLAHVQAPECAYPMVHRLDEATLTATLEDPLRAICFEQGLVLALVAEAGLETVRVERGTWAGEEGVDFQDVLVLRRPSLRLPRLRAALGPAKRAMQHRVKAQRPTSW